MAGEVVQHIAEEGDPIVQEGDHRSLVDHNNLQQVEAVRNPEQEGDHSIRRQGEDLGRKEK